MSNQGFIPVDVDIDVLENEPEYIQVRLAGQFTPQESGYWNGLARLTDLNNMYKEEGELYVELLGEGYAWLDTGTLDSLHEAASYVQTMQHRQGVRIGCPNTIARRNSWVR